MDTTHSFPRLLRQSLVLGALGLLVCGSALAQWQWKDASGRRVFSDTAPPASVPERDILKRPGQRATTDAGAAAPAEAVAGAAPAAPAATNAGADARLDEKKKLLDKAEADKKAQESKAIEAKNAKIRADNCESARRAKAALDSGARMATTNAKGEMEYLDEGGRAAQQRKLQDLIRENCR